MESLPVTRLRLVPSPPLGVQDAAPLSVRTYRSGNWSVVELAGEMDLLSAPPLRPLLEEHPFVVLDLRQVSFVDCSGLRLLADRARTAARVSGCLRVAGASPWVRKLMGLTQLDSRVSIFESVADALSAPTAALRDASGSDRD